MSDRVLTTSQAGTLINQMLAQIQGPVTESLNRLQQLGDQLSDPNVWDGGHAQQFRGQIWPSNKAADQKYLQQLQQLQQWLKQVHLNIGAAGGTQY